MSMNGKEQETKSNKQLAFADAPACLNALRLQEPCLLFIAYCSANRYEVQL